jgi:Protein of unknown function (DUF998)
MTATAVSTTASSISQSGKASTTRALLTSGALAGPGYLVVYFVQAFTRPGFDIARHPASVLSNGDLGWIQITSFVVTGLLVIAGAIGTRRALHPGRAGTWGPVLFGLSGLGMMAAAIFSADPVDGFPPGTPLGPPTSITTTGLLHFVVALVGFIAWIMASFVFARRFGSLGERGWATFSWVTGVLFLLGFGGAATGSTLPLVGAVVLMFVWISALFARLRSDLR